MTSQPLQQLNRLQTRWKPLLSRPDWYLSIIPEIEELVGELVNEPTSLRDAVKARLYDFFEFHLVRGDIALGPPCSVDGDRKPIDTIVIHHTSNPRGMRPSRLSAIELIRLYAPYFAKPTYRGDKSRQGQPIYSGHVRNGEQVFWPYHWIVRHDGRTERLLQDSEIGWHAGNWEVNCRSVAIALDGDYEEDRPSFIELQGIGALIRRHYPKVSLLRVVGHREVNPKTSCPSNLFLDSANVAGWKSDLLALMGKGDAATVG